MEQYEGFKGDKWKNEIDVKQFILDNYTEYTGDDSFLASPTEKTKRLNDKYQEMSKEYMMLILKQYQELMHITQVT